MNTTSLLFFLKWIKN